LLHADTQNDHVRGKVVEDLPPIEAPQQKTAHNDNFCGHFLFFAID